MNINAPCDSVQWTLLRQFIKLVVYDNKGRSYWPCYNYVGAIEAYAEHKVAIATLMPHLDLAIARQEHVRA